MNQKKGKHETTGHRNTNGKESVDAEELGGRAVKLFVIGRKNRLFSTSPKGADAGAVAYSIINTAQANGIDVKEYLTYIFCTGERRLPLKSE